LIRCKQEIIKKKRKMKILEQEGKDKRVKILEEEINEKSKYLKTEYK